jgi:hypothetical protein
MKKTGPDIKLKMMYLIERIYILNDIINIGIMLRIYITMNYHIIFWYVERYHLSRYGINWYNNELLRNITWYAIVYVTVRYFKVYINDRIRYDIKW